MTKQSMRPTVKVRGHQGKWYADAGEFGRLPTAHKRYFNGLNYHYDHAKHADALQPGWRTKYAGLLDMLRDRHMVIMTEDQVTPDGTPTGKYSRLNCVGIFEIADLVEVDGVLNFRLTKRVADTKP